MDLVSLREYVEAKGFWVATALTLVGIFLSLTGSRGLLWLSAAIAVWFLGLYPHVRTWNRWRLYSRRERIFQICSNVFFTGYLGYLIVWGLMRKGAADLSTDFGVLGGGLIAPLALIMLEENVPRWARGRKRCPDCLGATSAAAKACRCGYRWPTEEPAEEG